MTRTVGAVQVVGPVKLLLSKVAFVLQIVPWVLHQAFIVVVSMHEIVLLVTSVVGRWHHHLGLAYVVVIFKAD